MFTQRRKNYKIFIYTAIIITLCLLIAAIAWPKAPNGGSASEPGIEVNAESSGEKTPADRSPSESEKDLQPDADSSADDDYYDDDSYEEETEEDNFPIGKNDNISGENQSYYLVKRAGDVIKVFFVDRSGNEVELETTDILYDMLGYEDQALFDQGYRVSSQEELGVLLQDFES